MHKTVSHSANVASMENERRDKQTNFAKRRIHLLHFAFIEGKKERILKLYVGSHSFEMHKQKKQGKV